MPSPNGEQPGVGDLLAEHRQALLSAWRSRIEAELAGRRTGAAVDIDPGTLLAELIGALPGVSGLGPDQAAPVLADPGFDGVRAVLADLSRRLAHAGLSPSETASAVFSLKRAWLETPELAEEPVAFLDLSLVVDAMGLYTFESFTRARESVIAEQAQQLLELSTPVIKLWDGVVAVPLVGTLDSARTQVITEKLLQTLVDTGSSYAIIDITGVPAVDTQVAQHLLKTVVAARLMGAQCLISGIRPQIAQTIVALGIEFGDIVTKATLADALMVALQGRGVVLERRPAAAS